MSASEGEEGSTLSFLNRYLENGIGAYSQDEILTLIVFICDCGKSESFRKALSKPSEFDKLIKLIVDIIRTYGRVPQEKRNEKNSNGTSLTLIQKACLHTLVNMSGEYKSSTLMLANPDFMKLMHKYWFEAEDNALMKDAAGVLANIVWNPVNGESLLKSHPEYLRLAVLNATLMENLMDGNQSYEMYARFICNISQTEIGRKMLVAEGDDLLPRLFVLLEEKFAILCRQAVVGTVKNCCMDAEAHEWLLTPEVDVLATLLPPLAGPEEFSEEEYSKLPVTVQYLPDTKRRDPDPIVRKTVLEALMKLCQKKKHRQTLREQNVYCILREYFEWESDNEMKDYTEDLINILIRTEDEIGLDDIAQVDKLSTSFQSGVEDVTKFCDDLSINAKPSESTD